MNTTVLRSAKSVTIDLEDAVASSYVLACRMAVHPGETTGRFIRMRRIVLTSTELQVETRTEMRVGETYALRVQASPSELLVHASGRVIWTLETADSTLRACLVFLRPLRPNPVLEGGIQ